jgi:hypothetical protein
LAKKDNPNAVKEYKIGQFVTLNDPNLVTVAGSRQLITPHSRDIYKILDIAKGVFSLRLMNLRTQGELTVVHSRVSFLSLDDINSFELGSDDLWENLTRLNIKNRNTFQPGMAKRKFQLIHPVPEEEEEALGLGVEDDEVVVEGDAAELDNQDGDDNTEDNPVNDNLVSNHHYNLRPRKVKTNLTTLEINKLQMDQINLEQQNSILKKQKYYDPRMNFQLELFKMGDKFHFFANKKGLLHHKSICLKIDCEECKFYETIRKFIFQENSLLSYELGYANLADSKITKTGKKLDFIKGTKQETIKKHVVKVDWNNIQLSSFYSVSLSEMFYLKI